MINSKSNFFQTYLLPGFVFQSLIIGGGYGTGREIVEFFLSHGPVGGLFGMILAMLIWSLVLALTFELARISKAYDYRSFIQSLLGKGWLVYEIVYFLGMILVISVLGSAAGELAKSMLGVSELSGIVVVMILVAVLAFYGTSLIEKVLSFWSIGLYAVYAILIVICYQLFGSDISAALEEPVKGLGWIRGGVEYSAYNVGIVPAVLFVVRHLSTRKQALVSGTVAGMIGMIPGIFIFLAMLSSYPAVMDQAVPADFILTQIGYPVFTLIFQIILFGTFIETGVGLIHGFNERVAHVYETRNKQMPGLVRAALGVGLLIVSVFIADAVGIISLIAKGYKVLTWGYLLAFVFPVLIIGSIKLIKNARTR